MKKVKAFLFAIFGLMVVSNTNAQTNVLSSGISIQGIARDDKNEALANIDQLDLGFTIYYLVGASTTETQILNKTAVVRTDNFGVFSYVLDISQAQYNLISNQSAYLKVTSGNIVFSNEKLQAVPYAIFAQNGVPTGSIMPFIGTVAPNGWLLCDGSAIPAGTYYDNLRTLMGGTNTPDLRAMFLRGTGTGNNRTGPALKTVVQDEVISHLHAVNITTANNGAHTHAINRRSNPDNGAYDLGDSNSGENSAVTTNRGIIGSFQTTASGGHTHNVSGNTANTGGTETRPINYGVNYIIKI
jgi:microcystin-dependent protein